MKDTETKVTEKSGLKQTKGVSPDHRSDWRAETLARVRVLIAQADAAVVEDVKWRKPSNAMAGVPVWSSVPADGGKGGGIICTGETYKSAVKLTFAKGASLADPSGLFNSSLEGNTRRAIDLHEGDTIDEKAFKALIRAAVALNGSGSQSRGAKTSDRSAAKRAPAKPRLLSGGNPQMAKAEGDAPVLAYIAAMPGWKRDVGLRLDQLIVRTVPGVRKAVKWNSPLYGVGDAAEESWFLGLRCFTKYIKVTFFRGASLRPLPPGASKQKDVRYLDIREDNLAKLDETQLASWVKQASRLPGWGGV